MSLFLKLFFISLAITLQLFGTANRLVSVKNSSDSISIEFSTVLSKSDVKSNKLDTKGDAQTYRQFFDIKAALTIKPQALKIQNLSNEIKISQFDKETIRIVVLVDKQNPILYKADGKTFIISTDEKQPAARQKSESITKEVPKNILDDLNLELQKKEIIPEEKPLPLQVEPLTRKKLIVIDPGHGGKDSGAIGIASRMEKNVVLNMAVITKAMLEKRGYEVIMTRNSDFFVELQDRTRFANSKGADLFISMHANAVDFKHSDPGKAKGVETFFLSPARSDRAKRAAEKENGASMGMMDELTKGAFLNILNREKIVASNKLAIDVHRYVLGNLRSKFKDAVDGGVREAPFWVLVGAQMPAILLEIGYITNHDEAERFDDPMFKSSMAKGIADGVDKYFDNN